MYESEDKEEIADTNYSEEIVVEVKETNRFKKQISFKRLVKVVL